MFFQDSAARTIWKIDTQWQVSACYRKLGFNLRNKSNIVWSKLQPMRRFIITVLVGTILHAVACVSGHGRTAND